MASRAKGVRCRSEYQKDTLVFRFESLLRYAKDMKFTNCSLLRLIACIYDQLGLDCLLVVSF